MLCLAFVAQRTRVKTSREYHTDIIPQAVSCPLGCFFFFIIGVLRLIAREKKTRLFFKVQYFSETGICLVFCTILASLGKVTVICSLRQKLYLLLAIIQSR